jgi:hypothetical protein
MLLKSQAQRWIEMQPKHTQEWLKKQPLWHDKDMIKILILGMLIGFLIGIIV